MRLSQLRSEIKLKTESLARFKKMRSKIVSAEDRQKREVADIGERDLFSE